MCSTRDKQTRQLEHKSKQVCERQLRANTAVGAPALSAFLGDTARAYQQAVNGAGALSNMYLLIIDQFATQIVLAHHSLPPWLLFSPSEVPL